MFLSAQIVKGRGSFSSRIKIGFSMVLAVALLGSSLGFWSLFQVSRETGRMVEEVMATERMAGELERHILINVARSKAFALSSEPQVGDALTPEINQTSTQIQGLLNQLGTMLTAPADKVILDRMIHANDQFNKALQALTVARNSGFTPNIEKVYKNDFTPAADELTGAVVALGSAQKKNIESSVNDVNQLSLTARWGLIIFSMCAFVLGILLSSWLVRRITHPIAQAVNTANQVSSLDLTSHIQGHDRDEAGRLLVALSRMQTSLHSLVHQVQGASHGVAEGATQIAAGNLDISSRTELAASFLQQTAASIEEIATSIQASLEATMRGEALAKSTTLQSAAGRTMMSEVMQTMTEINDSSRKIVDITSVINGIAFQTNILALNAAVEAARAGEQGRGFAVVASEVRALANRSAQAAREIKTLIDTSVAKITVGTAKVKLATDTMSSIASSIENVTVAISEIHAGSSAQSASMASINAAIGRLDQMTQQNAAVVEESAAAAKNLQDQAHDLRDVTSRFRLPGGALVVV
jgi:methyl-accepting chemotaxis protein